MDDDMVAEYWCLVAAHADDMDYDTTIREMTWQHGRVPCNMSSQRFCVENKAKSE